MFLGNFLPGATIDFNFTTRQFSTGAPHQLAGSPAVRCYKGSSTTEDDSGITLTADFDSVTGLNHVTIDTSSDGTFYAAGSQIDVVISAGSVDSVSVVGEVVGRFIIGNVPADVRQFGGSAGTFSSGRPEVNATHIAGASVSTSAAQIGVNVVNAGGTAWGSGAITASAIASDAITAAKIASGALTAAKFAAGAFDAVWSVATRVLTAGTNIVLAKGTGVTGFNDLDAAGVRSALGLASANLDTQLAAIPTVEEINDGVPKYTGTLAAGGTDSFTLDSDASNTLDFYKGDYIFVKDGTGAGQGRWITGFSTGRVGTPNFDFAVALDDTSVVAIYDGGLLGETHAALAAGDPLPANVKEINDVTLTGDGSSTGWGPA